MGISARGPSTQALACAYLAAWANTRPRREVFVGRETRHLRANLCQDPCCRGGLQPRDALKQGHRFLIRKQALLYFVFHLADGMHKTSQCGPESGAAKNGDEAARVRSAPAAGPVIWLGAARGPGQLRLRRPALPGSRLGAYHVHFCPTQQWPLLPT